MKNVNHAPQRGPNLPESRRNTLSNLGTRGMSALATIRDAPYIMTPK